MRNNIRLVQKCCRFFFVCVILPQLYRTTGFTSGIIPMNIRDHYLFYERIPDAICPEQGKLRSRKVGGCRF
ncbi:hypothetical protein Y032_0054g2459 [Ancylostoma ceylanicum]|uniref:Uncharacterized protein n=1 Tax=Ancylostoma ceylanicum TaxID=53326 RepID=A0A016U702_9BILA|nr:hypothetical protein Y032_0054g2459 [Ancylostoma ceylanicum]